MEQKFSQSLVNSTLSTKKVVYVKHKTITINVEFKFKLYTILFKVSLRPKKQEVTFSEMFRFAKTN